MNYKFEKKFSEKHLDNFINKIFINLKENPEDTYYFDFIDTEWISNQELLVFTAILDLFHKKEIEYSIDFFQKGTFIEGNKRKALLLITLWDNWRINEIIPNFKDEKLCMKYLGFKPSLIQTLKEIYNINLLRTEFYEVNNNIVTPFQKLPFLEKYTDIDVINYLEKYNSLEDASKKIIEQEGLEHSFLNKSFGSIIIKELYENFLDHFSNPYFTCENVNAYFSLSVKNKIKEVEGERNLMDINNINKNNFLSEKLNETKNFFFDKNKKSFKNESYLEFSFLDFGEGIVNTLKQSFLNDSINKDPTDSNILKYAFEPVSSKSPIHLKHYSANNIPRGLFDVLSIVERYKGMLVARNNYGKILFDFSSDTDKYDKAFNSFGDQSESIFPGTLISIYIPVLKESNFDNSRINIRINYKKGLKIINEKIINLYSIFYSIKDMDLEKSDSYQSLIEILSNQINQNINSIKYINFRGCENFDERLTKKTIYYLVTDYNINLRNNIIALNPPSENIISQIKAEILSLNQAIRDFVVQPLPLIYNEENEINVKWIGVSEEEDEVVLNNLLFGEGNYSITKNDFKNPGEIVGNLNYFDIYGNLYSLLPSENDLLNFITKRRLELFSANSDKDFISRLIHDKNCIKKDGLYLCNGNYYQEQYLELNNLLDDIGSAKEICQMLLKEIRKKCKNLNLLNNEYIFLGVTSASDKILKQFREIDTSIVDGQIEVIDSYSFLNNEASNKIKKDKRYILVCDAISTGFLTEKVDEIIKNKNSELILVSAISNLIDPDFEGYNNFLEGYSHKLISLIDMPIKKYRRNDLNETHREQLDKVIRINPYTNTPITFRQDDTLFNKVLINNEDFLNLINDSDINIGFNIFNNLIHPYFFSLRGVLNSENEKIIRSENDSILKRCINKLEIDSIENIKLFYPKKSDIQFLILKNLKISVLKNGFEYFELDRFLSNNGWKFPHIGSHFEKIINNNYILLLDDGSCSGDSLLQMINEVSYFLPRKIYLLCIVGRVDDHKREFFSKLKSITSSDNNVVDVEVYFSSYWHIPTFNLSKNPYYDEIEWLKELLSFSNIPLFIQKTAENILEQINPIKLNKESIIKNYRYMIPKRESDPTYSESKYPKKDMLFVRDKIGQVIVYRYYVESFDWFNILIKKLEENKESDRRNRYKNIELLSMCLLYEPYLYEELCRVLPDFREKMEEFIQAIIFGNPKRNNRKINIDEDFYYNWSAKKKDLIHLLFIIYKSNMLEFLDKEKITKLFDFAKTVSAQEYIFYKITTFYNGQNNQKKLQTLKECINEISIDSVYNKLANSFLSFIRTLPQNKDFYSQLQRVKNLYENEEISPTTHKQREAISFYISELIVLSDIFIDKFKNSIDIPDEELSRVYRYWETVKSFLEEIISFVRTFKDFFNAFSETFLDSIISNRNSLLFNMMNVDDQINNVLYNWNISTKEDEEINKGKEAISIMNSAYRFIDNNFLKEDSIFYKIINNDYVTIEYFKQSLISNIKSKFNKEIKIKEKEDLKIFIPKVIFDKIIIEEIIYNLEKYADPLTIEVNSEYKESEKEFFIVIENKIVKNPNVKSTGIGLKRIDKLTKLKYIDMKYESYHQNSIFKQEFIFKKI